MNPAKKAWRWFISADKPKSTQGEKVRVALVFSGMAISVAVMSLVNAYEMSLRVWGWGKVRDDAPEVVWFWVTFSALLLVFGFWCLRYVAKHDIPAPDGLGKAADTSEATTAPITAERVTPHG